MQPDRRTHGPAGLIAMLIAFSVACGPAPSTQDPSTTAASSGQAPGASAPPRAAPPASSGLMSGLGSHHHPIRTMSPEAQALFDQGVTLVFGFNHEEAVR